MPRWIFVPLIVVTSAAALVIGFHSLFLDDARGVWLGVKLAGCIVTLAGNLAAIIHLRADSGRDAGRVAVLLVGMGFIALGVAGFVWTLHLAVATGDMEAAIALINGLIAVEGALLIWDVHRSPRAGEAK
jgi:hypothetical protein